MSAIARRSGSATAEPAAGTHDNTALLGVHLMQINAVHAVLAAVCVIMYSPDKWLPVSIAPADVDLEVCVMDKGGFHALVFPVRKRETDWIDASTKQCVDIAPTHWRPWSDNH